MLTACPGCRRFVRAIDNACPFCESNVTHRTPRAVPRMSRAAAVALAASTTIACSSSPVYGAPVYGAPAYGLPAMDAGDAGVEASSDAAKDAPSE